ncbi:MAG: hypothetical protein FJ083_02895 [Cyanobacteria bacterium K_Offshore_surface_m2_239]|nr:hypothetical protein [Cyanobacteria bacterium K_Offshore_surface_m2_239]
MVDRGSSPTRRPAAGLGQLFSLPALLALVFGLIVVAGLALLPGVVWQVNPFLWRQLLRVQGGLVGLVVGAPLGFLIGRLTARRR